MKPALDKQDAENMAETVRVFVVVLWASAIPLCLGFVLAGDPYYLGEVFGLGIVAGGMAWLTKRVGGW